MTKLQRFTYLTLFMLTGYFSSTHAQGTLLNEYCILKGRVKNDLYKFIAVVVYESLFSKKDTISIDQAGYFEKKIAFSGKRDILLRYGDDNCRIYLESTSINLEWDGQNKWNAILQRPGFGTQQTS